MRKAIFAAGLIAIVLTGCARRYAVELNDGTRVTAFGKPKLEGNAYVFKDDKGQVRYVPAGTVREIGPNSESDSFYNPGSSK